MKVQPTPFKNADTCEGNAYTAADAPLDMAVITISGRYPERGWAVNETVYEMVYVEHGSGALVLQDGVATELRPGTVVHVEPGQGFAWEGNLKLIMACQPPFSTGQYSIKEEP